MFNLLQLVEHKVAPAKVKKVSSSKGGEYHCPCPLCGGTDRFSVFPEQPGGSFCQKHGLQGTWACVRGCGKGGDLITWFTKVEGLSFKQTCAELNIPLADQSQAKRGYRHLTQPQKPAQAAFIPKVYGQPSEQWQISATKLALEAYYKIYDYPFIMAYLAKRGLPQAAIDAYCLGYLEGEGKNPDVIYRPRSAYGLPEKTGKNGKLIRAFRMPRGITIPVWTKDMQVLRIRIRRRDVDRDKLNPKDPKYLLVPQPDQPYSAPLMLFPKDTPAELTTWVVTEAELDAMAVHYACAGKVGAMSILTAKGKPDKRAHAALSRSCRILVALDADADKADGANPGAEAWLWWKQTYPQAKLWPVPVGKDPGEAFALGVDLAEWILAGLPLRKNPTASGSNMPPPREDGNLGPKKIAAEEPEDKPQAMPVPVNAQSFNEIQLPERVSHHDLLRSLAKYPLNHPECLVPCPKTEPPFWWKYMRNCKRCKGHTQCLLDVLKSKIFLEALEAYAKQ